MSDDLANHELNTTVACTAFVHVFETMDGRVTVRYCLDHCGHPVESNDEQRNRGERQRIGGRSTLKRSSPCATYEFCDESCDCEVRICLETTVILMTISKKKSLLILFCEQNTHPFPFLTSHVSFVRIFPKIRMFFSFFCVDSWKKWPYLFLWFVMRDDNCASLFNITMVTWFSQKRRRRKTKKRRSSI